MSDIALLVTMLGGGLLLGGLLGLIKDSFDF